MNRHEYEDRPNNKDNDDNDSNNLLCTDFIYMILYNLYSNPCEIDITPVCAWGHRNLALALKHMVRVPDIKLRFVWNQRHVLNK